MPSSGSIISAGDRIDPARGVERLGRGAGTSSPSAARKPSVSGVSARLGRELAEPLDQARRLDERVVGDPRHRAVAAAPVHVQLERRAPLLGRRAEVEHAPADLDPVAGALVDRVVAAHGVRVRLAEPLEPVRRRPRPSPRRRSPRRSGRRPAGTLPGRARRSRPRSPPPGSSCRARRGPRRAVAQLARPRIDRPLRRVGEHGVGVREQEQRRAVAACPGCARRGCPLGLARVQLALDAERLEVVAQQLGRQRLVPRRVDGVQADQRLEEPRRLRRGSSPCASRG